MEVSKEKSMIYNSLNIAEEVNKNGYIQINDFFNLNDFNLIQNIIKNYQVKKGGSASQFPLSIKSYIVKLAKLEIKKIYDAILLKKISKSYNFKEISDKIFDEQTILQNIDTYYNNISSEPVLDWHCDLSNKSSIKQNKILNPKMASIKFFFYLTDVYTDNGCLSYIPGSHKIVKEIGSLIFKKEIKYKNFWSLENLVNFAKEENVKQKLIKNLNQEEVEKFFDNASKILNEKKNDIFDIPMKKGGMIIFDEYGVHRGSKTKFTPRKVIRYFYRRKNINEKFRYC